MKQSVLLTLLSALWMSCNTSAKNNETSVPVKGTWELIAGTTIVKNDTTVTDYTKGQKMIKIINDTHFAFLRHDLNQGKDSSSAIFDSGAGRYTLKGDQYTEHLDYCNYREWEGHTFEFTVSVVNDTLTQSGIEKVEKAGIDRKIIEKYIRAK